MNFFLVFLLALSGAVNASPVENSNELTEVLDDFNNLLDDVKKSRVLEGYLIYDIEFNVVVRYFFSDEFKDIVQKIEKIDSVINFYNYLEEAGLDAYGLINSLHEIIGLPAFEAARHARSVKITGGTSGFIADYKAILPTEEIEALHEEKLKNSPAFARFVEYWKSPRFQELIVALRTTEEFQKLIKILKDHGIDVNAIGDLYATMLGLEFPKLY